MPGRSFNEPCPIASESGERYHSLLPELSATKRETHKELLPLLAEYGRTCKDIGCQRDQICVIAEDPCSIYRRDNCGSYPTCVKARAGGKNAVDLPINPSPHDFSFGENQPRESRFGLHFSMVLSVFHFFVNIRYRTGRRGKTE